MKKEGWVSLFLLVCILGLVAWPSSLATRRRLSVGDISPINIKAPAEINVLDEEATGELQKEALSRVRPVYTLRDDLVKGALEEIGNFFGRIRPLKGKVAVSDEEIRKTQGSLSFDVPLTVLTAIVTQLDVSRVEDGTKRLVRHIMERGVVEDVAHFSAPEREDGIVVVERGTGEHRVAVKDIYDLKNLLGSIDRDAAALFPGMDRDTLFTIKVVARNFIRPNLQHNEPETRRRQEEELKKVAPVSVSMKRGEMIVREGERLTPEGAIILKAIYASERKAKLASTLSLGALAVLSLFAILMYLYKNHPVLAADQKRLLLLVATLTLTVGLARLINSRLVYANALIPAALSPILISLLVDVRASVFASAGASLMIGLTTGYDLTATLQSLAGGGVGLYSVRGMRSLGDLFGAGFMVAVANLIVIVSAGLIREVQAMEVARQSLLGVGSGMLTALLAVSLIPLIERLFGLTSDISLAKLRQLSNPLLMEMRSKAPGTYQHSLRVAELSEEAARAINANPLLARVGSYYIDIGKMRRPTYFLENQVDRPDDDEKISPSMGSLIIINHVKDGTEIAYEHRLPEVIADIIRQHHGTVMISHLYERAKERDLEGSVKESDYSYPGPKPQTREAGIIMLADSVAAASRRLADPTPSRIASLVKRVVNNKFIEGQLDECNLTLKDIKKINEAFVHVLISIFHIRPEKDSDKEEPSARLQGGSNDRQPDIYQDKGKALVESG
jgi:putative nucleotidyltransferase with HDIG domain